MKEMPRNDKCRHDGCLIRAAFGMPSGRELFCKTHKSADMINIHYKGDQRKKYHCQAIDCEISPNFGYTDGKKEFCSHHKKDGMIDLSAKYRVCQHENCNSHSLIYGLEGGKVEFCKDHKPATYVNLICRCKEKGCPKSRLYNFDGKPPILCADHKKDGMINVKRRICQYDSCKISAQFGFQGCQPKFCTSHKLLDMIDVVSATCSAPQCSKRPYFGYPNARAMYCSKHQLEGMTDYYPHNVYDRGCIEPDCKIKQSTFGHVGEVPTYCAKHKKENMINVYLKTCLHPDCGKYPSFAFAGEVPSYCGEHMEDGMISVKGPICDDCDTRASFGFQVDRRPSRCTMHKDDGMIDICNPRCSSCNLFHVKSISGLCSYCDPDRKRQKTKEFKLKTLLESELPDHQFIHDKTFADVRACSDRTYRPDFTLVLPSHVVIIEVDECCHNDIEPICEVSRMISIGMSAGGLPVVIIRFNPDGFKIRGKNQKVPERDRHDKLIETVHHAIENMPEELLTTKYLFYTDTREKELQKQLDSVMLNY